MERASERAREGGREREREGEGGSRSFTPCHQGEGAWGGKGHWNLELTTRLVGGLVDAQLIALLAAGALAPVLG